MRKTLLLLALVPLLMLSCSGKKDVAKKADNPGMIYVEGVELMKKKKWDQAISKFSQIRENYPFDPMADIATVKLGDVYFERKEYLMASSVYTDFVNSHPDDENAPYVLWRLGESFERLSLTIDRDQTYTLKGIERLTYLQNRYPANQYALDATAALQRLTEKLSDRELYVGEFYYRTGNFNAATIRLEYFLNKYPGAKGTDRALFTLSAAYRELADIERSQYYIQKLTSEYPNSPLLIPKGKKGRTAKTVKVAKASTSSSLPDEKKPQQIIVQSPVPVGSSAGQKEPVKVAAKDSDSGTGRGVTSADQQGGTPPAGDKVVDKGSPLSLTEEKKPRQIVLRPPVDETSPAAEEKQTTGDSQQGAEGQIEKEKAAKPEGKGGVFGFFSSKKPVDIVSDTMEGLDKGKIIIFKGNVLTKQDDLQIFSDTLTAHLNEESNEVERADAEGNVKIVKQDRTATCNEAIFENAKGEITLKGDAVVYSGADRLAGDTIIYYINEDRVTVAGEKDKRARVTVQPK
ncbi:MAG TPA: lipopolysaccharide transport periplasmic protein LptA [Syntrophorhabdales bacterium]|nr:lipopolysaccharide transport periplasmic protein LptA [Syntrophorhabdales bacterium]